MNLKAIVDNPDTPGGRAFFLAVQALIFLTVLTFSLETLPDLDARWRFVLYVVEVITVSLFTIEYALRVLVADNRWAFVFSFYGLVDLLAVLPFYISTGLDLERLTKPQS